MKIIMVTHHFGRSGGQSRVNYEVVRHAAKAGHETCLISASVDADLLDVPGVHWVKATHGPLPTALVRNFWFAVSSARALRRIRQPADVVVVNGGITFGSSDINAVHFVHGGWRASPSYEPGRGLRGLYQRLYGWLNAHLERGAFAASKVVVAVSRRVAAELEAIGVATEKIRVVPNGVDVEEFNVGVRDRAKLGLPENATIALFVGDITTERKNLATVLLAMSCTPGPVLVVVGSTTGSRFPLDARRLGLESRVIFLGFRRDIADLMKASDIFVFPSRYEACSLVLLEALASGLPIITAETAGGAELIPEEAGVKLVDPNDAEALARELSRLAHAPQLRQEMGAAARRHALSLTWENTAQGYLDLCTASARSVTDRLTSSQSVGSP